MTHADLNAWILHWKAAGFWAIPCASCGTWFAQQHKGLAGRKAVICKLYRCELYRRWVRNTGRVPDEWMIQKWRHIYGDKPRTDSPKAHEEPRWCGTT